MYRFILGILFVVVASDPIQAYYTKKEYRYEYTESRRFFRVFVGLTQVPIKIPDEAIGVNLRYNMITDIPINSFSNLRDCQILSLSHNEISRIGPGMFNGLNSLTELFLYGNKITTLGDDSFSGLNSLRVLYLGNNSISTISDKMFSGLVSLKTLYLDGNKIYNIKDSSFLKLGNLASLNLCENQLEHLRPNTFAGLGSLARLDLRHNKLTTLDPLVLAPLPRPLELALDAQQSPMVCDVKLCWLKKEEKAGSIQLKCQILYYFQLLFTFINYPTCTAGVDWQSLPCPATIPCSDPGQVAFAERSGSFLPFNHNSQAELDLPYSTDSEFTYTCDPGYTGGGTITCQSNGQWTKKSECVRLEKAREERKTPIEENRSETTTTSPTTSSPTTYSPTTTSPTTPSPTIPLPTTPSPTTPSPTTPSPTTSSTTTYSPTTTSPTTPSPTTPLPTTPSPTTPSPTTPSPTTSSTTIRSPTTSSPSTSTTTTGSTTTRLPTTSSTTSSTTTGSTATGSPTTGSLGSSGLIYAVGGAVGGIVVTVIIGLTIFCIIRSNKNKPSDGDTVRTQNPAIDGRTVRDGNSLYEQVGDVASEAGYMEVYSHLRPIADRGTPQQGVNGGEPWYTNLT